MPHNPVILFQPPNGIGLGHMSRLAAIARAAASLDPSVRVPFVIEGDSHGFLEAQGLSYLTLPSRHALDQSELWASWGPDERRRLVVSLSQTMMRELKPDAVVFDCFPSVPFAMAALDARVPLVLCLRRMRDLQEYFSSLLARFAAYQVSLPEWLPSFDLILVPEEPGTFALPDVLKPRAAFVGPIVRDSEARHPPFGSAPGASPGGTHLVITGGGGGFPATVKFYNAALRAFARLRSTRPTLTGVLITGPLFTDWLQLDLVDGIRVLPFASELTAHLAAADVIVCQAGYNTMAEVAQLGRQTICIPASRGNDDQFERAERMAATHPHIHLLPERVRFSDADAPLAALIATCLEKPSDSRRAPPSEGARLAAERLFALVTNLAPG
jgi:predicted glycosyltransferase